MNPDDPIARPDSVPPSGPYSTYQAWQLVPPPLPEPPRRRSGPAVIALVVVALIVFLAGTAFGRVIAPAQTAAEPTAAAPTLATPAPAATPPNTATPAPGSPEPSGTPGATPLPEGQVPAWKLLDEAYAQLRQNYVDQSALDPNILEQGAIRGMLQALDDRGHTGFLTGQEAQARDQDLSGSFVGVGIVLDDRTGAIVIERVLPDSPAQEASVQAGDTITAVGGTSIDGLSVEEVVPRVRGEAGTQVTLTLRSADGVDRNVTMTRRKIELPLVSWALVPGSRQAVVRLESFSSGASDAVIKALTAARAAGATGIVFDLRGNPGGYVDEAVKTASQFVGSGDIYVSVDKTGKRTPHAAIPGGLATDLPLVVLVDDQTASSAEIVTGAIQDAGRGVIVGTTTYGTGTVVGTYDLSDGSAVTIGIERWVTPKGRAIWREGLTPDRVVALPTGVTYVTPDTFATLGTGGIAGSKDAQLKAALDALAALK